MIRQWFDPRGAVGRQRFLMDTTVTWLIGNLGFLAYFLAKTPVYSFAALGHMIDHRPEALAAMELPLATVALALWLAQVWALAALSSKRLHDMGQGGWWAALSLVPGVRILFWLALCSWPSKASASVRSA